MEDRKWAIGSLRDQAEDPSTPVEQQAVLRLMAQIGEVIEEGVVAPETYICIGGIVAASCVKPGIIGLGSDMAAIPSLQKFTDRLMTFWEVAITFGQLLGHLPDADKVEQETERLITAANILDDLRGEE